jgi:hypothetical protein
LELLSGTAHLKRGGRNPTEGAKNRARSLTVARSLDKKYNKWKKSVIFLHISLFFSNFAEIYEQ